MASVIDTTGLTLSPELINSVNQILYRELVEGPFLNELMTVITGVKVKTQIARANRLGLMGQKDDGCTPPTSTETFTFNEKWLEPLAVGDQMVHCDKDVDPLFKRLQTRITRYAETFELVDENGNPIDAEMVAFVTLLVIEQIRASLLNQVWLGNKTWAAAGAATEGLIAAGDVKFFNRIDGIFQQVFAAVTAGDTTRITITESQGITPAAQLALADGAASAYFRRVIDAASPDLRAAPNVALLVTNELWQNYANELKKSGVNYDVELLQNGLRSIQYDFYQVINMEIPWKSNRDYFVAETTTNTLYFPHRILFTSKDNILVGTLSEEDFGEVEIIYDKLTRLNYIRFGYTIDAIIDQEDMVVAAY